MEKNKIKINPSNRGLNCFGNKSSNGQLLEASICTPLWSRLSPTLLQLMSDLLGVRVLQGFHRHCCLGPSLPLSATLIHYRGLHRDSMSAQDGKIQQELGAKVVIVGLDALLDLISFRVKWNLKSRDKHECYHEITKTSIIRC